ncbi:phosphotransacetylase family protein [Gloeocapsopsis sp. IPPAS B-1203]|uniref:phosphotransacetylase family protein n=1 Tax=Gloeocapsopsis sp. IPPAS B-1203 TaxID=2049454 RepID=UPI0025A0B8D5|nr:phosphotransacetylase family protein [Gloeocapsopsis sp. IPPAS B-1203]
MLSLGSGDVPNAKYLLIGSMEAYSGKSATVLGLSDQLKDSKLDIAYGKPLGNWMNDSDESLIDADVQFINQILQLPENKLLPSLLTLNEANIQKRLRGEDTNDYQSAATQYLQSKGDLVLLEGPGTLEEGSLFGLSLLEIAEVVDAKVLLVARYKPVFLVEALLSAKRRLGDRLIGLLINDIAPEQMETVNTEVRSFLEKQGVPVLGTLPKHNLLRSVSVAELVQHLGAEVLCRPDRLDLMVESLAIGAMNVNAALKYFRRRQNMAVVTGGDRVEIQLAALESSTQCLILTGQLPPPPFILSKAEELEIPILSVDLDTLSTVEIIDRTFGQVRLHEPIKVQCIRELMQEHFDIERLLSQLELKPAVALP